jgi:response regulator of citrate/malate metabolism
MSRESGRGVSKRPEEYLPATSEYTVEEVIDIAKEATTLLEVCQETRLTRQTVRKLLRACERYHEVEFGFGNDAESAVAGLDTLREQIQRRK